MVLLGLFGLILIRLLESLFYDPLTEYFKNSIAWFEVFDSTKSLKFYIHTSIRFFLNTLFSLIIIKGFFDNKAALTYLKLSLIVITPMLAFYFFSIQTHNESSLRLFYTRRLLIQPMLGILAFLTFYYLDLTEDS